MDKRVWLAIAGKVLFTLLVAGIGFAIGYTYMGALGHEE
jgi:hypothetical protein